MGAAISSTPQKLLLFLITTACASGPYTCNMKPFDIRREGCCNNQTYEKRDEGGNLRDCCDLTDKSEIYILKTHLCCEGRLIQKNGQSLKSACKYNKIYHPDQDVVCPGAIVHRHVNHTQVACCGSQIYNKSEKGCCMAEDLDNCNLLPHPLTNDEDCCGRERFNRTMRCITGKLYPINIDTCGNKDATYDKEKEVCCRDTGKVLTRPPAGNVPLTVYPDWECCNDQLIDRKKSDCMQKRIVPTGSRPCGSSYINPNNQFGVQERCCDKVVRNASSEKSVVCCGDKLIEIGVDVCCNHTPIDTVTQTCCSNTILPKIPGIECCNNMFLYNVTENVCCPGYKGVVIKKTNLSHTDCCGSQSFNNNTQMCKDSQILDRISESPKPKRKTRHGTYKRCPYCGKRRIKNLHNIVDKKGYMVRIDKIDDKGHWMILRVTLVWQQNQQKNNRKIKLRLKVPRCHCFKVGKKYIFLTSSPVLRGKLLKVSDEDKDVLLLWSRKNIVLLLNRIVKENSDLRPVM